MKSHDPNRTPDRIANRNAVRTPTNERTNGLTEKSDANVNLLHSVTRAGGAEEFDARGCVIDGCAAPYVARGLCRRHCMTCLRARWKAANEMHNLSAVLRDLCPCGTKRERCADHKAAAEPEERA